MTVIGIDAATASRTFEIYAASWESISFREPLTDAIPIMRQGVRDNFNSAASPDNIGWAPRKREGDGHPLLMDTGALLQAATGGGMGSIGEVDDSDATIGVEGSAIPYAAVHNDGGQVMPQREYMGIREEKIDEIESLIVAFVIVTLL